MSSFADILGEPEDEGEDQIQDLQEGYEPDYNSIAFVDPGLLIAIAQLKEKEVISREEARELLGLDSD